MVAWGSGSPTSPLFIVCLPLIDSVGKIYSMVNTLPGILNRRRFWLMVRISEKPAYDWHMGDLLHYVCISPVLFYFSFSSTARETNEIAFVRGHLSSVPPGILHDIPRAWPETVYHVKYSDKQNITFLWNFYYLKRDNSQNKKWKNKLHVHWFEKYFCCLAMYIGIKWIQVDGGILNGDVSPDCCKLQERNKQK